MVGNAFSDCRCSKSVNGKAGRLRQDTKGGDDNEMICYFLGIAHPQVKEKNEKTLEESICNSLYLRFWRS